MRISPVIILCTILSGAASDAWAANCQFVEKLVQAGKSSFKPIRGEAAGEYEGWTPKLTLPNSQDCRLHEMGNDPQYWCQVDGLSSKSDVKKTTDALGSMLRTCLPNVASGVERTLPSRVEDDNPYYSESSYGTVVFDLDSPALSIAVKGIGHFDKEGKKTYYFVQFCSRATRGDRDPCK